MRLSTSFRGLLCKPAPTGSLVTESFLSRFWRPRVQIQGVGEAAAALVAPGRKPRSARPARGPRQRQARLGSRPCGLRVFCVCAFSLPFIALLVRTGV